MKKECKIKPDVMNILCRDPQSRRRVEAKPIQTLEPTPEPKKSFWGRVGGFFQKVGGAIKKAASFIKPVLTPVAAATAGVAALLNAIIRFKESSSKKSRKPSCVEA